LAFPPSQFFLANLALHFIDTQGQQYLDEGEDESNQVSAIAPISTVAPNWDPDRATCIRGAFGR
jgi:hypothetical protein